MKFPEYLKANTDHKTSSIGTYVSQFRSIIRRNFPDVKEFEDVPSKITPDMVIHVNNGKEHPVTDHFNSWWMLYSHVGRQQEANPHGELTEVVPTPSAVSSLSTFNSPASSIYRPYQKWAYQWTCFGVPLPDPNLCLLLHMLYSSGSQAPFGFIDDVTPFELPMATVDIRDLRWVQFVHQYGQESRKNPSYYLMKHKDAPDHQPYGWKVPGTIVRDMAFIHAKMNNLLINYTYPLGVPPSNVVASIPGSAQLLMDEEVFYKFYNINNALAVIALGTETQYSYERFFTQWQTECK